MGIGPSSVLSVSGRSDGLFFLKAGSGRVGQRFEDVIATFVVIDKPFFAKLAQCGGAVDEAHDRMLFSDR